MEVQREVVDATSREVAQLDDDRAEAERHVAMAKMVERARAEARLGQVKSALATADVRLLSQLGAIVNDADD